LAGAAGLAAAIGKFAVSNPDTFKSILEKLGFRPNEIEASQKLDAMKRDADIQADNINDIQEYVDAETQRIANMDLTGGAAAAAATPTSTTTSAEQPSSVKVEDPETGESLIDRQAGEQSQTQSTTSAVPAATSAAASTATSTTTTPTPRADISVTDQDIVPEEPQPQQTQTQQTQSQPASSTSSVLPAVSGTVGAGLGALANAAGPTASIIAQPLSAGITGVAAGAGSAASAAFDPATFAASTEAQVATDLIDGAINNPGAAGGLNFGQIGLNMGAGLLGSKMWGQGNESNLAQNIGSTMGGMAGSALLGSQLGMFAGPVGILAGSLIGSLLDEGSNPDPLMNPITGRMVEWNDPEWAAVEEWYQRNSAVPQAINAYDYSTEDQARLQSMFDMGGTDPGVFDPKAVEDVTYNATGLKFDPMSFEEFAKKTGYTGSMDPANFAMYNPEMKGGTPPPTTQPATTQPVATQEEEEAVFDPLDYMNQYYSDNMYGYAEGGEIPDAGESDLGPHEYAAGGKFLRGDGDGMSDDIVANIDGTQEARLADGEFVIPADVVSHLGNGSSEAGSRVLYAMMDRVRKARTGTTKQGKQIDPDDHVPA
jgi:hypothetical protein